MGPQLAQTDKHLPITGLVKVKSLARLWIRDHLLLVVFPVLLLAHERQEEWRNFHTVHIHDLLLDCLESLSGPFC